MIKEILKVGIIGLGVGQHHLNAFNKNKNSKVVAICDFDKEKLQTNKKVNPNLKLYQNSQDLINNKELDIISIASFDNFHYEQVIKSLKNKKHIFIEKPLCLTSAQLKNIQKLIKINKSLIVSSNMVLRANPRFNYFKSMFKRKLIKNLYFAEGDYYWSRPHKLYGWRKNINNYSIILGASIHMIDLILWMIGERPTYVESVGNKIGSNKKMINSDTFSSMNLIFRNNLIIKINAHGLSVHPHYHSLKFFSENYSLFHQLNDSFILNQRNSHVLKKVKQPYPFKENRSLIIDNFIDKIRNKKVSDKFVNFEEICNVMSICFSALKSKKIGRKVKIKYQCT